ncbi:MAG: heavy metal translocating P-type ATPase, partial [Gemmatimonadaceae bacterium]
KGAQGGVLRLTGHAAAIPGIATVGVLAGAVAWLLHSGVWPDRIWLVALVVTGSVVVLRTLRGALQGQWASDVVATLAIITAAIMNQPLAGLIVVVMQTGGEALERYAEGRASRAVQQLEADRPKTAHVMRDGTIEDVAATAVVVGDTVIVRAGELVPCDGIVVDGTSDIDTSMLTGEPVPRAIHAGIAVGSGSVNGDGMFSMRATAIAEASQYERIVQLVRAALATKAPFQRIADRYAVWFTPITLAVATVAAVMSGDYQRFLAVLVVATPCPLILAPPIAIIGGINRAARRQIIVRNGAAIERLADVNVAVFDKTGTLTVGKPIVRDVIPRPPFVRESVIRLAGAVEQGAAHLLARTLVDFALAANQTLPPVRDVRESPGRGVIGTVGDDIVAVGSHGFITEQLAQLPDNVIPAEGAPGLNAYVAINGRFAGVAAYDEELRGDVALVLADLAQLGIRRTVLLSGDHENNTRVIAAALGITEVHGDVLPAEKVAVVKALTAAGDRVLMVGDGANDAPALSAATVGIALAGHGGGVTAEAADLVILVDELSRVPEAIRISRRSMSVARESIWAGLALSGLAMLFAAAGKIDPVPGALLQEVIDIAVILNALRASGGGRAEAPPRARASAALQQASGA